MPMSETQIYISYARADDTVPPDVGDSRGFASMLAAQLTYEFTNLGPPQPRIWLDRGSIGIVPDQRFDEAISAAIRQSSIFLVVLSQNWIASKWCQRELAIFVERWRSAGEQDISHRIVIAAKRYVPPQERPALLQGRVGYQFYTVSDRETVGGEHEFFARGEVIDKAYYEQLRSLARHLWQQARAHARGQSPSVLLEDSPVAVVKPVAPSRPAAPATVVAAQPVPSPVDDEKARERSEYWLHRVEVDHKLPAGGDPLVLVSYASEDQAWVDRLHAFVELRVSELHDTDGKSYTLWNFSDAKRGTAPGDEFPEIVAEKMWRCRAAILLFSVDYFTSPYCRRIELPFLMWRWEHQKIMCMPVKLGTVPIDKVKIPAYKHPSRNVILNELIDDRQASEEFASSAYRDRNLKELKEMGLEAETEKRFDGVARRVVDFLKKRHKAQDD
jgi:hypothetical protein